MFQKLIKWFRSLWSDTVAPGIEETVTEDYRTYLTDKYGITQVYAEEPDEGEKHWRDR
jgi:hypothetical protein